MKKSELVVLKSVLGNKVVSYHPVFARALRSVPAAVMLSQAYFWQENALHRDLKEIDGRMYFTATAVEWYETTGVTDDAQVTARKVLNDSGIWMERRAGVPAKLYFHVDLNVLVSVIYGYLNSGIQVTVDTRHKNRELTRASDGKFRQPVTVNYGNNIKEESLESLESTYRETTDVTKQPSVESQKKEKAPPVAARPPAVLFSETHYATYPVNFWAVIQQRFSDVPTNADFYYYHKRCLEWSDNKQAINNDWPKVAAKFILDDQRKGQLHTYQPSSRHDNDSANPAPGSRPVGSAVLDTARIAGSVQRLTERRRRQNG